MSNVNINNDADVYAYLAASVTRLESYRCGTWLPVRDNKGKSDQVISLSIREKVCFCNMVLFVRTLSWTITKIRKKLHCKKIIRLISVLDTFKKKKVTILLAFFCW